MKKQVPCYPAAHPGRRGVIGGHSRRKNGIETRELVGAIGRIEIGLYSQPRNLEALLLSPLAPEIEASRELRLSARNWTTEKDRLVAISRDRRQHLSILRV